MHDDVLLSYLRSAESEQIERKESFKSCRDDICAAVCAFANDLPRTGKPGIVAIGQSDDLRPAGLAVTDELLRNLADLRTNGQILPFPRLSVRKVRIDGGDVAVVIVEPSSEPPVRFRGRTWIRVGPSRRLATAEEERALTERRHAANLPFDARPLDSASLDDLDLDRFSGELLPQLVAEDVLAENHRPIAHQLASLRFIGAPDEQPTPTGLLVTGSDPEHHLPGAYVQFLRFDGSALSDPIRSEHRVTGTIPDVILETEEVVRSHIDTIVLFEGRPKEERRPSVPFEALQQLIRNALLHRTYETSNAPVRITWLADRVEIHSPGGPYGQVTVETLGKPGVVDYRNPTLAGVLNQLGFVQRFGIGIEVSRARLAQNGNPPLEFAASINAVAAIVRLLA